MLKNRQTILSQNSVSFVPGSWKKRLTAVFSIKSKVAVPKTEVLGQPQILCAVFILWICSGFTVSAQSGSFSGEAAKQSLSGLDPAKQVSAKQDSGINTSLSTPGMDINQNIMLARSSADYRVTPGDIYTLAYAAGTTPVSYIITVDTSYRIRVSNMGIVNGNGKTFAQLKSEVEAVVVNNYPLSGVQLVLTQPAVFRVYINGEVQEAKEVSAWGLSRLSALVEKDLTDYASIRDISVKSTDGQTQVYDLFKAQRLGDLSQDPYLRPGDVVTFNRLSRFVTVDGQVERPGEYQLLDGENLKELIEVYANGLTPLADLTKIEMTRLVNSEEIGGEKIFLSSGDLSGNYVLEHLDSIFIPSVTLTPSRQFFVTVSGSVVNPGRYLYMPERKWDYYIFLAGGFMPGHNSNQTVTITDVNGKKIGKNDIITPETNITAETNHFLYHFNQYAPVITTILTIVTTLFTVIAVTK
jgi:protein involved in polysaccharide export with SLBB domain